MFLEVFRAQREADVLHWDALVQEKDHQNGLLRTELGEMQRQHQIQLQRVTRSAGGPRRKSKEGLPHSSNGKCPRPTHALAVMS